MTHLTFQDVRDRNLLLYEYIRGSHAYGLQKPDGTSDIDTAGVYLEDERQLLGLGLDFQEEISDDKHDNVWFGIKKFMSMLLSSNPTVLESLFIPDNKVLFEHPIMTEIKKNRDLFVTKACFFPFMGYAKTQIIKARGLNKKIVNPVTERLQPLDFAYTYYKQGSTKVENWLGYRGLKQQYCGIVHIPNMHNTYGLYYDWGTHIKREKYNEQLFQDVHVTYQNSSEYPDEYKFMRFVMEHFDCKAFEAWERVSNIEPIGYKGMVGDDGKSNELRLSSVAKGERPICYVNYNKDGYIAHCKDYNEYKQWEKNRNPERYKENTDTDYDRKNVSHSVRLMHMGIEIAKTGKVNVDRTNIDRDFILSIRLGNRTYDEVIAYLDQKKIEMENAMAESNLPDAINVDLVNDLLIKIRKQQLGLI